MHCTVNTPKDVLELFEEKKLVTVCAPMVRYSKLQFRTLVREYNCDLCYTPMIMADSFCQSSKARDNEFTSSLSDSPLIVQFAANTVHDFVGAAYMVSPYCSGVDLNCGCPQTWAKQMGIGCSMLNRPELISDIVKQCRNRINKPFTVSVKLRILKDLKKTVELCQSLEKAGVSFLGVHARTPSQHLGSIDAEGLKLVVENVNCPVIGNGGVKTLKDCLKLQEDTGCKGIMAANGLLTNPTLFTGSDCTPLQCVQNWLNICYNSTLPDYDACETNVTISNRPLNLTFQCFHHHLVFMLEKILPRAKRRIFNSLQNFHDVLLFLNEQFGFKPVMFDYETFQRRKPLDLDYINRNEVYHTLKLIDNSNKTISSNNVQDYCYNDSDGKFFKNKIVEDDSSNLGLENMFI
ncbi:hypothetical protein FQR65_LT07843 [Abscondita terminalis]|nr:hypothetical protein FQR65_LT07843 [Abscondita terminalis]